MSKASLKASAKTLPPEPAPAPPAEPPPPPEPQVTFGSGKFVYDDGSIYEGAFAMREGVKRRHGQGRFAGPHFSYTGEWEDDAMHGAGSYIGATGCVYAGAFELGAFNGQGKYRWPDGATYEGGWLRNKMHGGGVYTSADGLLFAGQFYNGLFVDGNAHRAVR